MWLSGRRADSGRPRCRRGQADEVGVTEDVASVARPDAARARAGGGGRRWPLTVPWWWSETAPTRSRRTWPRSPPTRRPALQAEQLGTGHAAAIAFEAVGVTEGTVVILNGDMPLLRGDTLAAFVAAHESGGAAATMLTARLPDPYGLGRIVRDPGSGAVDAVVEERDATAGAARDPGDQRRDVRVRRRACSARRWASSPRTTTRVRSTSPTWSGCSSPTGTRWPASGTRPDGDARLQRPGAAGVAAAASCATGSTTPGCSKASPSSTRRPPGST